MSFYTKPNENFNFSDVTSVHEQSEYGKKNKDENSFQVYQKSNCSCVLTDKMLMKLQQIISVGIYKSTSVCMDVFELT